MPKPPQRVTNQHEPQRKPWSRERNGHAETSTRWRPATRELIPRYDPIAMGEVFQVYERPVSALWCAKCGAWQLGQCPAIER